ncbi:Detected protein of confused Function [Hibiscus syriacus]|uniref:Detected protein of confused Function n=1 Tax=Hibiscus syriacus TaxID=106335 RepID=A0A6A2YKL5_HIBSY|nr:Detected protein of confused Function [Hibiscus syriacus]
MMERAESCQKLYTRLRLWEFPDEYVIETTDGSSASSLSINRVDASIKLVDAIPECSAVRGPKIQAIFGVVGMLKLVAGSYLIVVTEHECVASYLGHPIFKVVSMRILPCDHSLKNSSPEQAEPIFLWNNYTLEVLIDHKLDPFLLPVVQGRSMPFLWEQIADLTYKPKFEIVKPEEVPRVSERHFLDLRKEYGVVLAIDLVNTTGDEGCLSAKFASSVEPIQSDDLRYSL